MSLYEMSKYRVLDTVHRIYISVDMVDPNTTYMSFYKRVSALVNWYVKESYTEVVIRCVLTCILRYDKKTIKNE